MRTMFMILAGVICFAVLFFLSRYLGLGRYTPLIGFAVIWLGVTLISFYGGIRAGYTYSEELPIHAVIFAIPAIIAIGVSMRFVSDYR